MCNLAQGLIIENRAVGRAEEKYEILINLLEQTDISLKKAMEIVGLVKEDEIKETIDKLIEDLTLKEVDCQHFFGQFL